MLAPDIGPVIIAALILLCYNPIMTAVFVNQRYNLRKLTKLKRWGINIAVCILTIAMFYILSLFSGMHTADFMLIYSVTITLLVILDRLAKRKNKHLSKENR